MTSPLPLDPKLTDKEWIAFPGGQLEAPRPKALCPDCRKTRRHAASLARKTLCFACYRMDLDRQRGIKAAAELNTASEERFQSTLPFEPVDRARLMQLRAARNLARVEERTGTAQYAHRRRQAQITARHTLERIAQELRARQAVATTAERAALAHAAEIQLPDSWLPYAVGR